MNPAELDAIRARLSKIRAKVARLADDRWGHEQSADADRIVIMRAVFDSAGKKAGYEAPVALCHFGPEATVFEKEIVRDAVDDMAFLLEQLATAGRMIRDLRARSEPDPVPEGEADRRARGYAAEASMKCGESAFRKYLFERHATADDGDLKDRAAAAAVLRRALDIESRKHLNTDPDAAQRWREMRADYQAWRQG